MRSMRKSKKSKSGLDGKFRAELEFELEEYLNRTRSDSGGQLFGNLGLGGQMLKTVNLFFGY